jgi:transitional endoplasmic reticulum ATPase
MSGLSRGLRHAPLRELDRQAIPCHRSKIETPKGGSQRVFSGLDGRAWPFPRRSAAQIRVRIRPGDDYDGPAAKLKSKAEWKRWRLAAIASAREPRPPISPLQERIDWLGQVCELTPPQQNILGLLARIARVPQVRNLVGAINKENYDSEQFDFRELRPILGPRFKQGGLSENGLLSRFGLIEKDDDDDFQITELVGSVLSRKRLAAPQIRALLLGKPAVASLGWDDFAHLGELRDLAERMVAPRGADIPNAANILIYGPPGTGKSEFVKTLAARLGFSAHFVGEHNGKDAEPERRERIAALMITNALGATDGKIIVAVDEADDLFAGVDEENAATRHGSKVFMNRLVERAPGPTIWIVNDIDRLGPAVVRRMNLVMRFPKPSLAVRKRMIARISDRAEFSLNADETAKLARLPAAPALIENAIRSAARTGGSGKEAQQILECGLQAMGSRESAAIPTLLTFDPTLSSAEVNLAELAERVRAAPTKALSFCLSGPSGTGKSAYARHLAEKLEMEALDNRYSDLISSYLGDSEKAIARAFEAAADMRAFLILDEADSLLRDRAAARYSWEITQVNEMLTQMERHPYPFACTTNAPDLLDLATARRFLFKVRFLSMTGDQIATAFRRAFGRECPEFVVGLENLTPGDFSLICRKAEAFGECNAIRLGRWLEEEAMAKPDGQRRIGF